MKVLVRRVFDGLVRENVTIEDAQFLIGRGDDCQLRPLCPLVSRHHCEIRIEGRRTMVRDLGSRNGTYVNCQRVEGSRELSSGDLLNVGLAIYEILLLEESKSPRKDSVLVAAPSIGHRWGIGLPTLMYT